MVGVRPWLRELEPLGQGCFVQSMSGLMVLRSKGWNCVHCRNAIGDMGHLNGGLFDLDGMFSAGIRRPKVLSQSSGI